MVRPQRIAGPPAYLMTDRPSVPHRGIDDHFGACESSVTVRLLRLCVLGYAALGVLMVVSASELGPEARTPYQMFVQGAIWSSLAKVRVFFALHALILAPLVWLFGVLGSLFRYGPSRLMIAAAPFILTLYYRLEPRYRPDDIGFLLLIAGTTVLGYLSALLALPRDETRSRTLPLRAVIFFLAFVATVAVIRVAGEGRAAEDLLDPRVVVASLFWFLTGALPATLIHGPARSLFVRRDDTAGVIDRWRVTRSLLLEAAVFWLVATAAALRAGPSALVWAGVAPFVPLVMSFYAPYGWFKTDSPSVLMLPELGLAGDSRGRLFLGIFFEYLTIATLWSVIRAVRRGRRDVGYCAAIVMVGLYWLPGIWLLNLIGSRGTG